MLPTLLALIGSAGPALADAKLRVTSDRPVVLVVNMVPYPLGDGGTAVVDINDGREGLQRVRIRNLLGQDVWVGEVDVPRNHMVTARWRGRQFEVVHSKRIHQRLKPTGSHYSAAAGANTLETLSASDEDGADPYLSAVAASRAHDEAPPPAEPVSGDEEPAEAPAPPSTTGGRGHLRLANRNTSWANVYVDGELHEFRGGLEPQVLELATGPHEVVIKDFRDKEVWARGTVQVYGDLAVELQFSKASPPAAINREEAWTPTL